MGVVTGGGGGGATPTLAQVLAKGADQNGVLITNTGGGAGGFDLGDGVSNLDVQVTGGHAFNPVNMGASNIRFKLSSWFFTTFLVESGTNKLLIQLGENDADEAIFAATGGKLGFYGTTGVALQTGVAVSAAGIHAALVNLGLITA